MQISHGTNVPLRDDQNIRNQQLFAIQQRQGKLGMGMGMGQHISRPMGMHNVPMFHMEPPKMPNDNKGEKNNTQVIEFRNIQDLQRVNTYEEYIVESKPFEGSNPDWSSDRNEFIKNKKITNYELFNSSNVIVVSLFDKKYIRKYSKTSKKKQSRTEHDFFLDLILMLIAQLKGNFTIPLYTLFQNQKLTATFRLNRPIIILGYYTDNTSLLGLQYESDDAFSFIQRQDGQHISKVRINPLIPTTISLSVNIDPFIEITQESDDIFYGDGQDSRLEYFSIKWLEKFKNHSVISKRHIKLWGNDIEQNSFYLPRYLRRLKPPNIFSDGKQSLPQDIKKDKNAIEKVARFVSLIPFKSDSETFKDVPDVHCDSQQFLDLKGGDFEEHAFLLCNYFNYIDFYCGRLHYKSYVILGHAIPEGKTFYVLRSDTQNNKVEVWNPQTGEPFVMTTELLGTQFLCCTIGKNKQSVINRYDKACPLYDVGCVIDEKNVYVNIQRSGAPSQIDWNIKNNKLWTPFLTDSQIESIFGEEGIESIYKSEDALKYEDTQIQPVQKLELTITNYIKNRIQDAKVIRGGTRINKEAEHRNIIKNELLQALEATKYICRLSGLGTQLNDDDNLNPMNQNNQQQNPNLPGGQQNVLNQFNNNVDSELMRKYRDAQAILEKITQTFEDYIPANKQLYGFPLNLPFITIEKIWDEIKQTGIHELLAHDIEYILDVKCFPYPNYIISVWVFIGVVYEE